MQLSSAVDADLFIGRQGALPPSISCSRECADILVRSLRGSVKRFFSLVNEGELDFLISPPRFSPPSFGFCPRGVSFCSFLVRRAIDESFFSAFFES